MNRSDGYERFNFYHAPQSQINRLHRIRNWCKGVDALKRRFPQENAHCTLPNTSGEFLSRSHRTPAGENGKIPLAQLSFH